MRPRPQRSTLSRQRRAAIGWIGCGRALTVQQLAIAWIALGVCFLALGVISLVTNERWIGAGYLLVGIVWAALAIVVWRNRN